MFYYTELKRRNIIEAGPAGITVAIVQIRSTHDVIPVLHLPPGL